MKTVTKLAISNVKENKSCSLLIGISIFLTTVLLTAVGLCGNGMIRAELKNAGGFYGEHFATYRNVSGKQLEEMKRTADFLRIGKYVYAAAAESEAANIMLSYMDSTVSELCHVKPEEGRMPEKENEIAAQKEMFQRLGMKEPKIGEKIRISYRIDGKGEIQEKEFTISGFTRSTESNELKNTFFAYISEEFYASHTDAEDRSYTIYFQVNNQEKLNSYEMEKKIIRLAEELGLKEQDVRINDGYLLWTLEPPVETILICMIIVALVVVFSSLVIYNIFHVGIIQKIKEYGKLKAIGATKKQLRGVILREGMVLAGISIPMGLIAGFIVSKIGFTMIVEKTLMKIAGDEYVRTSLLSFSILLIAAVISLFTVYISLQKPMKIAGSVSVIEAIRYQEQGGKEKGMRKGRERLGLFTLTLANLLANRKRTLTTIATMGLSCVLFVTIANVAGNMDAEYEARKDVPKGQFVLELDGTVYDSTYPENNYMSIQKNNPFGAEFLEKVRNIEGVTAVETEKIITVKNTNKEFEEEEYAYDMAVILDEKEFTELAKEAERGIVDYEKAAKENGVIYLTDYYLDYNGLAIGENLEWLLFDGNEEASCSVTIQGTVKNRRYGTFAMTEDTFQKTGMEGNLNTLVYVDCERGSEKQVKEQLESLIEYVDYVQMDTYENALNTAKMSIGLMQGTAYGLLAIIGIIGFMNMANTMITSIITRKRELGILQAVGMTPRQLNGMLQLEGLVFTAGTILVALVAGTLFGYMAFSFVKNEGWFGIYEYHFPVLEIGIMIGVILFMQIVLSLFLSKKLQKESLVERISYEG